MSSSVSSYRGDHGNQEDDHLERGEHRHVFAHRAAEYVRGANLLGTGGFLPWVSCILYMLISLTDKLDGYLARSRGEVTDFGKCLDPIADKLAVIGAFLYLLEIELVPSWAVLLIVAREFLVSGLRMVVSTKGVVIAASNLGKWKTATTMTAICGLLVAATLPAGGIASTIKLISDIAMWIALALTAWSGIDYFVKSWKYVAS